MSKHIIAYGDDWCDSFGFYMTILQHFQSEARKKTQKYLNRIKKNPKKINLTHLTLSMLTRSCNVSMINIRLEQNL